MAWLFIKEIAEMRREASYRVLRETPSDCIDKHFAIYLAHKVAGALIRDGAECQGEYNAGHQLSWYTST